MKFRILWPALGLTAVALTACQTEHKIEADTHHTVEVKPIHVTVDVNVRVDRELDDVFAYEDQYRKTEDPDEPSDTTTK